MKSEFELFVQDISTAPASSFMDRFAASSTDGLARVIHVVDAEEFKKIPNWAEAVRQCYAVAGNAESFFNHPDFMSTPILPGPWLPQRRLRQEPEVSVIMPMYNAEKYVEAAVRSALAQFGVEFEILIVDDHSKDQSVPVVQSLMGQFHQIRLLKTPKPRSGAAQARNLALRAAKGRFVAFLDSDDLWLPGKLWLQLTYMEAMNCALSYTAYRRMDEAGVKLGRLVKVPSQLTYADLLLNNPIATVTAVVDTLQTGGLQMPDIEIEDYATWLTILKSGFKAFGIPIETARYRKGHASLSSNKWRAARRRWHIYRRFLHLSRSRSLILFFRYAWSGFIKHSQF